LFAVGNYDAEPVKTYRSKPPAIQPEKRAGVDLFDVTPSPSVAALKAHAEKRLQPADDEKPVAIGMDADRRIGSYDEAYRQAMKAGKPLRVVVGQPPERVAKLMTEAGDAIQCELDVGDDPRFAAAGVFDYEPLGRMLVNRQPRTASRYSTPCPSCGAADCSSDCRYGGVCRCANRPQRHVYYPPPQLFSTVPTAGAFSPFNAGGCAGGNCGR
jgi:hypothetical protein